MEEDRILNLVPHGMECGPFLVGYAQAVHDMRKDDEQFRRETAKDILMNIVMKRDPFSNQVMSYPQYASAAIKLTDELIKQLKEARNEV